LFSPAVCSSYIEGTALPTHLPTANDGTWPVPIFTMLVCRAQQRAELCWKEVSRTVFPWEEIEEELGSSPSFLLVAVLALTQH